ncbi:hypothetical protein FQA47_011996 [Oryzias melastigma]|uniref:Uncharacterized protein n=1 Tax=Oryzias melastigma TaxID=30732 RepID=A0A834FDA9_ORYME|nr:hypothetical protein FQA47_011996 [Oryzias melastigma]
MCLNWPETHIPVQLLEPRPFLLIFLKKLTLSSCAQLHKGDIVQHDQGGYQIPSAERRNRPKRTSGEMTFPRQPGKQSIPSRWWNDLGVQIPTSRSGEGKPHNPDKWNAISTVQAGE